MKLLSGLNGLLLGIAAMITAVIGVLAYLDSSGKLENPVGNTVTKVVHEGNSTGGNDGNGGDGPTNSASPTTSTSPPDPTVESLTVDGQGCAITLAWVATGDSNGSLELLRDGELLEQLPVESDSREESAFAIFGEGTYEASYELVAFDSEGLETDRESASDTDTCVA